MKEEIDALLKKYGEDDAPPPWSMFTLPNDAGPGNLHVVQKVFEGSFEVSTWACWIDVCVLIVCTVRHHILFSLSRSSHDL